MATHQQIDSAIKMVSLKFDGASGNCARFAAVLNKVLGGVGNYLLVDSGHYEYSDHVYLSHDGCYFDSYGLTTRTAIAEESGFWRRG